MAAHLQPGWLQAADTSFSCNVGLHMPSASLCTTAAQKGLLYFNCCTKGSTSDHALCAHILMVVFAPHLLHRKRINMLWHALPREKVYRANDMSKIQCH
jgi:hypothetical protein